MFLHISWPVCEHYWLSILRNKSRFQPKNHPPIIIWTFPLLSSPSPVKHNVQISNDQKKTGVLWTILLNLLLAGSIASLVARGKVLRVRRSLSRMRSLASVIVSNSPDPEWPMDYKWYHKAESLTRGLCHALLGENKLIFFTLTYQLILSHSQHTYWPLQIINFLMSPNIAILAGLLGVFLLYLRFRKSNAVGPLPPGPKPIFALGNIRDLTKKELWLQARKWAKEYGMTCHNEYLYLSLWYLCLTGSVCHLHVLGQSLIFLNTPKAVLDLMDKRGAIYSDRPHLVRFFRNTLIFSWHLMDFRNEVMLGEL